MKKELELLELPPPNGYNQFSITRRAAQQLLSVRYTVPTYPSDNNRYVVYMDMPGMINWWIFNNPIEATRWCNLLKDLLVNFANGKSITPVIQVDTALFNADKPCTSWKGYIRG